MMIHEVLIIKDHHAKDTGPAKWAMDSGDDTAALLSSEVCNEDALEM